MPYVIVAVGLIIAVACAFVYVRHRVAVRRAEEEARCKAEEEARRKAEEEARRKAEEEARRKAEEEARRKAEEEARRKTEEEARRKAEEEARRKAEEEARREAEEEARRKATPPSGTASPPCAGKEATGSVADNAPSAIDLGPTVAGVPLAVPRRDQFNGQLRTFYRNLGVLPGCGLSDSQLGTCSACGLLLPKPNTNANLLFLGTIQNNSRAFAAFVKTMATLLGPDIVALPQVTNMLTMIGFASRFELRCCPACAESLCPGCLEGSTAATGCPVCAAAAPSAATIDLWLENCPVPSALTRELPLVKLLVEEFHWDLMDCAARLSRLPTVLARELTVERARELEAKLSALGAQAALRPAEQGTPDNATQQAFDETRFTQLAIAAGWPGARCEAAVGAIREAVAHPTSPAACVEAWDAIGGASQGLVRQCLRDSEDFTGFAAKLLARSPCPAKYAYPLYRVAGEEAGRQAEAEAGREAGKEKVRKAEEEKGRELHPEGTGTGAVEVMLRDFVQHVDLTGCEPPPHRAELLAMGAAVVSRIVDTVAACGMGQGAHEYENRGELCRVLADIGTAEAVEALARFALAPSKIDEYRWIRHGAAEGLHRLGSPRAQQLVGQVRAAFPETAHHLEKLAEQQRAARLDVAVPSPSAAGTAAQRTEAKEPTPATTAAQGAGPQEGSEWTVPELGMELVWVEAGAFDMGSDDVGFDAKPVHRVSLSRGFWVGKCQVTNAHYQAFVKAAGYDGSKDADSNYLRHHRDWGTAASTDVNYPVVCVSWNNAVAFCKWLTERERSAGRLPDCYEFRLPTEAEWEFAARGGTKSKGYRCSGSNDADEVAWSDENSGGKTHPVGGKRANELGIHDMSGNVWEWCWDWYCWDWYRNHPGGAATDPCGPQTGSDRVFRGGSRYNGAAKCRVAFRCYFGPSSSMIDRGFRACLAPAIAAE